MKKANSVPNALAIVCALMILGLQGCGGGGDGAPGRDGAAPGGSTPPITGGGAPPGPPPVAPAACGAGPNPAVTILLSTSRLTGAAPLSVFFDATSTTATATTRPFHELEYRWNFGDGLAGAGNWTYGSRGASRAEAIGPVAAHVFEIPGTYNVCLSVTDGTNTSEGGVTITVLDPDIVFAANTVCASTSGNFGDCPAGALQVTTSDFDQVVNTTAGSGATRKRILFRRGETFLQSASANLSSSGPGILGAFGPGTVRPVVTGATTKLVVGGGGNNAFGDWRIVDLDFDGVSRTVSTLGVFPAGAARQLTFWNLIFRNLDVGVNLSFLAPLDAINAGAANVPLWNEWTIGETVFSTNRDYGFIGAFDRSAILGSLVIGQQLQHAVRIVQGRKFVISNNELVGTSSGNALTVRGIAWDVSNRTGGSPNGFTVPHNSYSEHGVISDNRLIGGAGASTFTFDSDGASIPRLKDHIFERNWVTSGAGTSHTNVTRFSQLITYRNNLWDNSTTTNQSTIQLAQMNTGGFGPAVTSEDFFVYNNTAHGSSGSGAAFTLVSTESQVRNLTIRNNLGVAVGNTNGLTGILFDNWGSTVFASNNSTRAQIIGASPLTATPPTAIGHWRPAGGYPIDTGTPVPVFSDFNAAARTGTYDLGAVNP